nr:DUF6143 family protein [Jeotgalibacillus alimentarius]
MSDRRSICVWVKGRIGGADRLIRQFIFPPGGSYIVFLVSQNNEMIQAEVAFGWFEKRSATL